MTNDKRVRIPPPLPTYKQWYEIRIYIFENPEGKGFGRPYVCIIAQQEKVHGDVAHIHTPVPKALQ